MHLILVFLAIVAAGCTKSQSYFFDGELIEKRPDGKTVSIPVLLEREIIASQNKIVIRNHQTPNGTARHFTTIYDFSRGSLEMQENSVVLSTGTFTCERNGAGLEALTSCTYTVKTTGGDNIHGTDSYQGTEKISFDTIAKIGKEEAQFTYSGEALKVSEDKFRSLLAARFKSTGGSGCHIDPAFAERASGRTFVVPILLLTCLIYLRMKHVPRRRIG